jgi:general nucleoside transport system ATP-binding protein
MSEGPDQLLRCRGITKRFGRLTANNSIDFDLRAGEVHAIVGENGAGKSTFMNVLYGVLQPDAGYIELDGRRMHFTSCADAIRAGIGMVFQHYLLVERFTVAENVMLGRERTTGGFVDRTRENEAVRAMAAAYRFTVDPEARVEQLGVGARQQVELLKVLERDPRIVILDEPTASLSPLEIEGLFDVVRRMRSQGRAIIFITHKLKEVIEISDRVTVLRRGKVVDRMQTSNASETLLGSLMIGEELPSTIPPPELLTPSPVVLQVDNLVVRGDLGRHLVDNVSLEVRAGEVVGVAGVEGNGQVEFIEALYGLRACSSGAIELRGIDVTQASTVKRRRGGLRYIPPDRQREGLVLDFDAGENVLVGNERLMRRGILVDLTAAQSRAEAIVGRFKIPGYSRQLPLRSYSGGTQQKFLVGRELDETAKAIIAFSPTRGVDIGAAHIIYRQFRQLQAAGACIILISYDLDEIRMLASRIVVFGNGRIVGQLKTAQADDIALGRLMGGSAA